MASIDELNRRTEIVYDELGRAASVIFADGATERSEYDSAGRVTATIDPLGNRTELEYDAAGQQRLVRDALLNQTETIYDEAGRQTVVIDGCDLFSPKKSREFRGLGASVRG